MMFIAAREETDANLTMWVAGGAYRREQTCRRGRVKLGSDYYSEFPEMQ